jgi:5-methylcytosine-specific restriction protein A
MLAKGWIHIYGRRSVEAIGREETALTDWSLAIGEALSRRDRGKRYGGGLYGGIEPSAQTANIFIYSDPSKGERFGYNYDGWVDGEDLFLYTGEGTRGHQQFRDGNQAVLNHQLDGRRLRLFVADGKIVGKSEKVQRYIGEFTLDNNFPYLRAEAPDVEGLLRSVIVFRLRPAGEVFRRSDDSSKYSDAHEDPVVVPERLPIGLPDLVANNVALEVVNAVEYGVSAKAAGIAQRREADLMLRFSRHLVGQGHKVDRYRIRPPEELRNLYTDLFDFSANVLYEAKASATREAVRMAIGQLLDYSRHIPVEHSLAVLLPGAPSQDLISLLRTLKIRCVCEIGTEFRDLAESP